MASRLWLFGLSLRWWKLGAWQWIRHGNLAHVATILMASFVETQEWELVWSLTCSSLSYICEAIMASAVLSGAVLSGAISVAQSTRRVRCSGSCSGTVYDDDIWHILRAWLTLWFDELMGLQIFQNVCMGLPISAGLLSLQLVLEE
eukprot:TRINITY_DN16782_c0_g1_i7.p1 TRINITY_DN16782_c0_g1~~TRINITY_DN16782_c0_g1_i7.p1  ORF type:complete len:146 (+),score=9.88 TRINITY_DN16782_c0_g1_i7:324-761(+)